MSAVLNKIKKAMTIMLSDNSILITMESGEIIVNAENHSPENIKKVAASFFKQAYKIDKEA